MPNLIIDLNAPDLSRNVKIWRVFPGASYKFLRQFLEQKVIFLDLPSLALPAGPITWGLRNDLRPRIALSYAVSKWIGDMAAYNRTAVGGNPPQRPGSDLELYTRDTVLANAPKEVGVLTRLFGEAKKGDLILVPGPSRGRKFYVGVLQSEPTERVTTNLGPEYHNETTISRSVKWFPAIDEFLIPMELSTIFRTQSVIVEVPNDYLFTICDLSYGTYFSAGHFASRLRTLAAEFMSQDAMDLSVLAQTAAKLAAKHRLNQPLSYTMEEILGSILTDEDQLSIAININSPGFLISKGNSLAPLVFVVLFSLFTNCDAHAKPSSRDVTIINSQTGPDDACTPQINEIVKGTLEAMGLDQWHAQCERAVRLKDNPRINSDIKVIQ